MKLWAYLHRTAATLPYWAPSSTAMSGWWKISEWREGYDWSMKLFEWKAPHGPRSPGGSQTTSNSTRVT